MSLRAFSPKYNDAISGHADDGYLILLLVTAIHLSISTAPLKDITRGRLTRARLKYTSDRSCFGEHHTTVLQQISFKYKTVRPGGSCVIGPHLAAPYHAEMAAQVSRRGCLPQRSTPATSASYTTVTLCAAHTDVYLRRVTGPLAEGPFSRQDCHTLESNYTSLVRSKY